MKKTIATLSIMALMLGATSAFAAQAKTNQPATTTNVATNTNTAKSKGKSKHKHHAKAKAATTKPSGK